ncbi:hypothetical protein [Nitratireductor sp. XY-223]|uniref:hypothetical protein n=1 Tax=Nitratireductor sp. XY-223 TaxID=2561926 RepID=UPI0010AA37C2|nr:hypothetical protein [Nitratireductor sp. XY-223]
MPVAPAHIVLHRDDCLRKPASMISATALSADTLKSQWLDGYRAATRPARRPAIRIGAKFRNEVLPDP